MKRVKLRYRILTGTSGGSKIVIHCRRLTGRKRRLPVQRSRSIRAFSDPITGRIILAHPNLTTVTARDGTTDFPGAAPNDLRVMAANATTRIRLVVVILRFAG